jgi:centrosomal protein CEP19
MHSKSHVDGKSHDTKPHTEILLDDYQPRRFGLKYSPPVIVLEYLVPSSGKLYHHKMRVHNLNKCSSIKELANAIAKRHTKYCSKIPIKQIELLVGKLLDYQKKVVKADPDDAKKAIPKESTKKEAHPKLPKDGIDYDKFDLNKLNDTELDLHKKKMDELFNKNHKDPTDEGFEYDIEVDFKPQAGNAEWDEDLDDDEDDDTNNDF